MKDPIQELAYEATAYCDTLDIASQVLYRKIWEREFARLIAIECIALCIEGISDPRDTPESLCAKRIAKHFDVV
jgi:hypothetical protein